MVISEIIELYNFIKNMNEDLKSNRKDVFDSYIDDAYQKANIVLKNYLDIFSLIRTNVKNENWGAKEVISYIEDVEYEHKDMRIYLRELKGTHLPPGFCSNGDYESFLNSITQILICKNGIREVHTLLGFAENCRLIQVEELHIQQQMILNEVNSILNGLEEAWKAVCISYNKIKV